MKTYVPKEVDNIIVKFNRKQLQDALDNLECSGANSIGIPVVLQKNDEFDYKNE
jgi:hypothetical protein